MLNGGAGADTLVGNAGDDSYNAVEAGESPDIVTEMSEEGMDTVYYTAPADNATSLDTDESQDGVTVNGTPANVEVVVGTQNGDTITANEAGETAILGLEGDDMLNGAAGVDTLVGCDGKNTLTGFGEDDIFGVFKPSTNDGTNADTIVDFTTGDADDATTDEIHLKGFEAGAVATVELIPGNSTHAGVLVDGNLVAIVTSITIELVPAAPDGNPPVVGKTQAEAIIEALGKSDAVVFDHSFEPAKCSSN